MKMCDITVIILTKNEEKNMEACIVSAKQIAKRVLIVDSGSTDSTVEIAKANGAETYYHEWPGHAAQFNWALDNCNIDTTWVFRLDADERISEKLAHEIQRELDNPASEAIDAYEIRWRMIFMDRWLKHGGNHKTFVVRLIRYGKARVDEKLMDERFVVKGRVKRLNNDFIHYDYKGLDSWLTKHIWYSELELKMYRTQLEQTGGNKIQQKKRGFYYRLPLFLRARLYYWYRYYFQLGFLDGREGKIFIYLQAYWYRFLVDAKIYEQEQALSGDRQ